MRIARAPLVLVLGLAIILGYETYAVFIKTEGQPGYLPRGSNAFLLSEVAGGEPLALEFAMHADGLEAIALYAHPSYEPPEGTVTFTLIDQIYLGGLMRDQVVIARRSAPVAEVVASQPYLLRLPRIDRSAGRRLRLEIAVTGSRPQHGLRLEAGWPNNADARLLTGAREEWGDLKFQTIAERTTIARTITKLRRTAPFPANTSTFWLVAALLFNWSLFVVLRDLLLPLPAEAAAPEAAAQTSSANRR